MTSLDSFTISFPESEKEKTTAALASLYNFDSVEGTNNLTAIRKKEGPFVLPRPDNTTTFLPALKGTTLRFSEDGGTWIVFHQERKVLELSSKGWASYTPGLKAVVFPVPLKDAPKKKTREEAFLQLKSHSSKLLSTMPSTSSLTAEALMSILPTLKTAFEKDLGYINCAFSLPGFDYLADLSFMGLPPVDFGDVNEDYFLLTRVTESKLSALMKKMNIQIPKFMSKLKKDMDVKNCFILAMTIVQSLLEAAFEKEIVVFVDLNNGNLGGTTSIFDCLDFLNKLPVSVQITRVGSKAQAHFCLRFGKADAADDDTRSWMETALRTVLAQTYKHLSIGVKLVSVTYEKDKNFRKLEVRHPLDFSGQSELFSTEEAPVAVSPKTINFVLEDADVDEEVSDAESQEEETPEPEEQKQGPFFECDNQEEELFSGDEEQQPPPVVARRSVPKTLAPVKVIPNLNRGKSVASSTGKQTVAKPEQARSKNIKKVTYE